MHVQLTLFLSSSEVLTHFVPPQQSTYRCAVIFPLNFRCKCLSVGFDYSSSIFDLLILIQAENKQASLETVLTMPPKDADSAVAQATKDTTFLATCFKHLKQQPQVDAAAVAAELKMSTGGVRSVRSFNPCCLILTRFQQQTSSHCKGNGRGWCWLAK